MADEKIEKSNLQKFNVFMKIIGFTQCRTVSAICSVGLHAIVGAREIKSAGRSRPAVRAQNDFLIAKRTSLRQCLRVAFDDEEVSWFKQNSPIRIRPTVQ